MLLYFLFYNLLLIRSFTTGSGTFILSRWSLPVQLLVFTGMISAQARKQTQTAVSGFLALVSATARIPYMRASHSRKLFFSSWLWHVSVWIGLLFGHLPQLCGVTGERSVLVLSGMTSGPRGRILVSEIFKQSVRMTAIFVNFQNPNKPFSERKQTFLKR